MQKKHSKTPARASIVMMLACVGGIAAGGCGSEPGTGEEVESSGEALLGDALPGTNATTFAAAKANFGAVENASDGLGPIYNANACGTCHQNGSLGGAGQQIERRYGTLTNGVFDPLANTGGSLRQLFGIGGFNVGPLNCNSGIDANPAPGATIFAVRSARPSGLVATRQSRPSAALKARRRTPIALAWATPRSVSGESARPWTRSSRLNSVWP